MAKHIFVVSHPPELEKVSSIPIRNALMEKYKDYEIGVNDYTEYYDRLRKERDELKKQVKEFNMVNDIGWFKHFRQVEAENKRLKEELEEIKNIAYDAPELNMSNYDHDQVAELNSAMCQIWSIVNDSKALQGKE